MIQVTPVAHRTAGFCLGEGGVVAGRVHKMWERSIVRRYHIGGGAHPSTAATTLLGNQQSGNTLLDSKKRPSESSGQRKFTSINNDTPYNLCFLRHGQSTWNRDNRFIGWTDTPLTEDGVLEARVAGQMLANSGMKFDEVHTSLLRRCIRTVNLVLMELEQEYIPVYKHWRLNERSYGALVGKNKKETVELFGKDQVKRWRRSYDEPPPPMSDDHEYHPARDPRYRHVSLFYPFTMERGCTLYFPGDVCSPFTIYVPMK